MSDHTPQQESIEELAERVRQEFYVNLNHVAGDEALERLISLVQTRLLDEVRGLVKKYDESPDDMAGFEIRIKQPTKFYKALDTLGEQK